jgi:hypothetical protein
MVYDANSLGRQSTLLRIFSFLERVYKASRYSHKYRVIVGAWVPERTKNCKKKKKRKKKKKKKKIELSIIILLPGSKHTSNGNTLDCLLYTI